MITNRSEKIETIYKAVRFEGLEKLVKIYNMIEKNDNVYVKDNKAYFDNDYNTLEMNDEYMVQEIAEFVIDTMWCEGELEERCADELFYLAQEYMLATLGEL